MGCELFGEARELFFDPRFAPLYTFFTAEADRVGITLVLARDKGAYVFTTDGLSTLPHRELHRGWASLRFWLKDVRLAAFPEELLAASLSFYEDTLNVR